MTTHQQLNDNLLQDEKYFESKVVERLKSNELTNDTNHFFFNSKIS